MSKLHTLWGKARDAADYDKSEWQALQAEIEGLRAAQRALESEICEFLAEPGPHQGLRLVQDAQRWRSLWACERIRVVGGAELGTPNALLGLDFHRKHPARDDADSRKMLLEFVDGVPCTATAPTPATTKPVDDTCPKCGGLSYENERGCSGCGGTGIRL